MKAGQDGLAPFNRCGHDHAVRFDALQFARLQVGDDHHLAVQELLGRISFGDSGDDGAGRRLADIDPRRVMRLVIPSLTLTISGIQLLFSSFVLHFLLWNVEADRI